MIKKTIYYIMGVSGSGKSTVGRLLAEELNIPFFDGDDYHPKANVEKMESGTPLNDEDRKGWLEILNELAKKNTALGAVIACSALKKAYRVRLEQGITEETQFVYLEGSFKEILDRLKAREGHFMPPALLKSQFDTLEIPVEAFTVSIELSPQHIVSKIIASV